ncbi:TRAP transporter small permease [Marinomonas sp. S3726]|uniref:TRAP transporter small permease n=1 Tax=Marinomonas sp. S3726 TaxID=579484 RepID=UPI0006976929|nr:TRAP transporter small permease [Marinomonas sp. S3726]
MKRIENLITSANKVLIAALLGITFSIVFVNVIGRYGFGVSISWAEEVARHLMILCAFSASGLALRQGRLVSITILPDILPQRFQLVLRWLIVIVMFVFMSTVLWLGVEFVQFGWNKETMATGISRGIPYLSIPIGCFIFLVQLIFFAKRFTRYEFEFEKESIDTNQELER